MITYPTKAVQDNIQLKAILLDSVSKKYPLVKNLGKDINTDFEDFWALKDASFEVYKGEILGIIGRNGAGKTTLLNIIAGVLSPTQGTVSVNGRALGLFNLGVGFQDELTGRENIFLNGAILGASRAELEEKLDSIVEFSELGDFINMPLGSYSQGMRLRLGFSIVTNLDFDILVIDEVLAVGDVLFQNKCFQKLMDFRRLGKTLIITTQSMDLIERLCDKALLLDHGHLLFYGDTLGGINRYRSLLNTEKFFVGPVQKERELIEDTKKWADDISGWGRELGTKEVMIESVEFRNKFGWRSNTIKSGEPLNIRVDFNARDSVKEPHFGIAIFRNDGVYCYGPNTAFDGYSIAELKPGKGYFILNFPKLLLAPGEYRISVAIWDKNETLAFNYHEGYYKLTIMGNNSTNELLKFSFKFPLTRHSYKLLQFFKRNDSFPDINLLNNRWGECIETEGLRLVSIKLLDGFNKEKNTFMTNGTVKLKIDFDGLRTLDHNSCLWVGIFREDAIYCQGIAAPLQRIKNFVISFPKLPLLPGSYRISIGIWDTKVKRFLICHHGIYPLKIVFDHRDHGTIYLKHKWHIGGH